MTLKTIVLAPDLFGALLENPVKSTACTPHVRNRLLRRSIQLTEVLSQHYLTVVNHLSLVPITAGSTAMLPVFVSSVKIAVFRPMSAVVLLDTIISPLLTIFLDPSPPANPVLLLPSAQQSVGDQEQPLANPRPYAKPISPTYAAKLQHGDFTVANVYNRAQAESYRVMAERQVKCYWFMNDNEPPEIFMCTIPNPPANFFHPKDDPSITAIIGKQHCNPYTVLLGRDWVTTTAPQRVQPKDILCFRSLHVTVCIGGPFPVTSPPKRRLSGESNVSRAKISWHSSLDSVSANNQRSTSVIDVSSDEEDGPNSSSKAHDSPTPKRFPSKIQMGV
ncbi:hypothetical protein B0H12DRAFT_1235195 [Mycena haematopus]|nr:hypothetical protein B0H12DRAFT_1235195 [Mycena haematopus]